MLTVGVTVIKYGIGEVIPYSFSSSTYLYVCYFS